MAEQCASPSVNTPSSDPGFNSPAPSEILKGVVAYVEVRTASDNRSAAVKWVLERMGAKVEDKFSDDVTHVIFKEGKKRTKDKAQRSGVHLVSVLWVDSCKEKQQRVTEHQFSANTERCGTPPPGIRWKKYKSMQPRDFDDELARSAERCQKRQQRKDNYRQLLQGDTATPFHSPAHVLVVDTQPRSPFSSLDIQTPMIIPNTPPSMQARLDQLIQEKEARRRGEIQESPASCSLNLDLPPLQRALFKDQTPTQEQVTDKTPAPSRRSSRLSGRVSKYVSSGGVPEMQKASQSTDPINTQTGSQQAGGKAAVVSETESQTEAASGTELAGEKERPRTQSSPETSPFPQQSQPKPHIRQKRRVTRQSLPCTLSQAVQNSSSQLDRSLSQNGRQNCDTTQRGTTVCARSNASQNTRRRARSQEAKGTDSSSSVREKDKTANSSGRQKSGSNACSQKRTRKKDTGSDQGDNAAVSVPSERPGQAHLLGSTGSSDASLKSVNRKRKLLNPSQERHILSPAPIENPNLPTPALESDHKRKRGQKRKSCDVDAVFPSSLPARKRGQGSSQMKENQKRISSTQVDPSSSKQSESSLKGRKRSIANKRRTLNKKKGDERVSSLCSSSQTPSLLGSSMSVVYDNSSRPSVSRFAPPRNSFAEFKVSKRQGKQAPPSKVSSSQERDRDPRRMSLQKFYSACMPSLVMTSLHREEQDFVIHAVKRLGVFRLEDKVSKHTTHVVCGEPRRTLNVLHGLARGCWLVSKEWVVCSVEEGRWVGEEDYEMVEDIPMSKEARLAKEAEDPDAYKCCIFATVGSIFVSSVCTPPRAQLIKLLQLCGAKVTESIHRADFYIGDSAHDEKNSIKPVWVLDCISQQELLPMDDYILAINYKVKSSSSPEF